MQKLVTRKILLVGDDEGPKSVTVRNLFKTPFEPVSSGVSLKIRSLQTGTIDYQFWCVDSHEFDNISEPTHYFKDCVHILIVPKDHDDLIKVTAYLKERLPVKTFSVLIPSYTKIQPLHTYYPLPLTFVLSKMTRKNDIASTEEECKQFIEAVIKNELSLTENKKRITAFTGTSFFKNKKLTANIRTSLLKDYVIPALLCLRT